MARALGIDQSSIYSWGEYPPIGRQYQLQAITNGKLKATPRPDKSAPVLADDQAKA